MKKQTAVEKKVKDRIKDWLDNYTDPAARKELIELMDKRPQEANELFSKDIYFGTGGIRGVMGIGTSRLNLFTIRKATQALANAIKETRESSPAVIISYDCRNHSREFAIESARVLAGNGIKAYIFEDLRPTPMASWGTRHFNCIAGIMITASHNPPEYNGYKVYWQDGAQVLPPHDRKIIDEYEKIEHLSDVLIAPEDDPQIIWIGEDADNAYLKAVTSLALTPNIDREKGHWLKVHYSPLYGAGKYIVKEALNRLGFTSVEYVISQEGPDGNFGGMKYPNPEILDAREAGISQMQMKEGDLCIFTDPDSDRMAVSIMHEDKPYHFNGNEIGILLASFILEMKREGKGLPQDGAGVTTIVSTPLFRELLENHQMACLEVLTGFKYIGQQIHNWELKKKPVHTYLFGFEESCGYLYGTHARDKDATIAAVLVAELALHLKRQGKTLLHRLFEIYIQYGIHREGQVSIECKEGQEKMLKMMSDIRNVPPKTIHGHKVIYIEDYMTLTRTNCETGETSKLTLPKSNVLVFGLDDHSKLIARPSGTEPKVKLYGQVKSTRVSCVNLEAVMAVNANVDKLLKAAREELFKM